MRGLVNEAEGQRNAAVADYELALIKLPLDGDGRRAQQQARDRIAALRAGSAAPPAATSGGPVPSTPGPTSTLAPSGAPGVPPAPTAASDYDSLRCRLLRGWAGHAEGYSGVKLLELDPACRPK